MAVAVTHSLTSSIIKVVFMLSTCCANKYLSCLLILILFCLLSVHGGKGIRYTANEDTPPEKGTSQQGSIKSTCPPEQPTTSQIVLRLQCDQSHTPKITQARERCEPCTFSLPFILTSPFYFPV